MKNKSRQARGPLYIHRESICGEMRHRVVKRYSDMTYWYVAEYRNEMGRWLPMTVQNQSGHQTAAEKLWYTQTT